MNRDLKSANVNFEIVKWGGQKSVYGIRFLVGSASSRLRA